MRDLAARVVSTVALTHAVRLVPLHGPGLARLGATAAVASGDYALSRSWARAIWSHPERADGIAYRARHDDGEICVALFDRAAGALEVGGSQSLTADERRLGAVLRRYGVGLTA